VTVRVRGGQLTLAARDHAGRAGIAHKSIGAAQREDPAALGRALAAALREAVASVAGHGADAVGLLARDLAAAALAWELAAPALEAAGLRLFRLVPRTAADDRGGPAGRGDGAADGGGPAALGLAALLRAHPVAVIHIRAALKDHHGTPALDLATPLTALALDRAIPRDLPAPLVVLDVPTPRRAAFATQLAAAGTVRAVLTADHAAARALQHGGDIYDVTRAVRAIDPLTALFARAPSIRFPKPC
jgi:hypothetical protein